MDASPQLRARLSVAWLSLVLTTYAALVYAQPTDCLNVHVLGGSNNTVGCTPSAPCDLEYAVQSAPCAALVVWLHSAGGPFTARNGECSLEFTGANLTLAAAPDERPGAVLWDCGGDGGGDGAADAFPIAFGTAGDATGVIRVLNVTLRNALVDVNTGSFTRELSVVQCAFTGPRGGLVVQVVADPLVGATLAIRVADCTFDGFDADAGVQLLYPDAALSTGVRGTVVVERVTLRNAPLSVSTQQAVGWSFAMRDCVVRDTVDGVAVALQWARSVRNSTVVFERVHFTNNSVFYVADDPTTQLQRYASALVLQPNVLAADALIAVVDCTFTANRASGFAAGAMAVVSAGGGGAVVIAGTRFTANRGDAWYAGALYVTHGGAVADAVVALHNCSFVANSAANGGAVALDDSASVIVTHSLFANNSAAFNGGAVSLTGKAAFMAAAVTFRHNSAMQSGGVVYAADDSAVTFAPHALGAPLPVPPLPPLLVHPLAAAAGRASRRTRESGLARYARAAARAAHLHDRLQAMGHVVAGDAQRGGFDALATNVLEANAAFTGGAVFATGECAVEIYASAFVRNSAVFEGGAVALRDQSFGWVQLTTFDGCVAGSSGGAVAAEDAASITFENVTLTACRADGSGGGGVQLTGMTASAFYAVQFIGCSAAFAGGALMVGDKAQVSMAGSAFVECRASAGGAVAVGDQSYLSDALSLFDRNAATTGDGGAFTVTEIASVVLSGTRLTGNNATAGSGGAVRFAGQWFNASNTYFAGNRAGGGSDSGSGNCNGNGDGGALAATPTAVSALGSTRLRLDACVLESNTALRGGACAVSGAGVELALRAGTSLAQNRALRGGALFVSAPTDSTAAPLALWLSGGVQFVGNAACTGGAVYVAGNNGEPYTSAVLTPDDVTLFAGNAATASAPGLVCSPAQRSYIAGGALFFADAFPPAAQFANASYATTGDDGPRYRWAGNWADSYGADVATREAHLALQLLNPSANASSVATVVDRDTPFVAPYAGQALTVSVAVSDALGQPLRALLGFDIALVSTCSAQSQFVASVTGGTAQFAVVLRVGGGTACTVWAEPLLVGTVPSVPPTPPAAYTAADCPAGYGVVALSASSSSMACQRCPEGFYSLRPNASPCRGPCPANVICPAGAAPYAAASYWLSYEAHGGASANTDDDDTLTAYLCPAGYCGGGRSGDSDDSANPPCAANRDPQSPLCGACAAGYAEWNSRSHSQTRFSTFNIFSFYFQIASVLLLPSTLATVLSRFSGAVFGLTATDTGDGTSVCPFPIDPLPSTALNLALTLLLYALLLATFLLHTALRRCVARPPLDAARSAAAVPSTPIAAVASPLPVALRGDGGAFALLRDEPVGEGEGEASAKPRATQWCDGAAARRRFHAYGSRAAYRRTGFGLVVSTYAVLVSATFAFFSCTPVTRRDGSVAWLNTARPAVDCQSGGYRAFYAVFVPAMAYVVLLPIVLFLMLRRTYARIAAKANAATAAAAAGAGDPARGVAIDGAADSKVDGGDDVALVAAVAGDGAVVPPLTVSRSGVSGGARGGAAALESVDPYASASVSRHVNASEAPFLTPAARTALASESARSASVVLVRLLTEHVRGRYYWWEAASLARRLLFYAVVTVADRTADRSAGRIVETALLLVYLLLHVLCAPYAEARDNRLDALSLSTLVVVASATASADFVFTDAAAATNAFTTATLVLATATAVVVLLALLSAPMARLCRRVSAPTSSQAQSAPAPASGALHRP